MFTPWLLPMSPPGVQAAPPEPFWRALEAYVRMSEPLLRAASCANLELAGLAAARARAWSEIPASAAACRSPEQLMAAQAQFWQTAMHDYGQTADRVSRAFRDAIPSNALAEAMAPAAVMRDVMALRETEQDPRQPAKTTEESARSRRAA
jgi:hypothetical protein